jgi:prepilin-type N-terminal cleavage/methylation domain-containing protein
VLVREVRNMPIGPVNRRGASLAELVVVVAILGVFAAIAVPRLNYAIIRRCKVEATARKVVANLRRVRRLAFTP